jgi:uncharacterized protein (DUF1330 family)
MNSKCKMTLAMLAGAALGAIAIQALHAQGKPPAYIITEVEIADEAAFKEFGPKVGAAVTAAGGKYLSRGGKIVVLEGAAPKRFVLSVFPSLEAAEASRNTPAWKETEALRAKATNNSRAFIAEVLAN